MKYSTNQLDRHSSPEHTRRGNFEIITSSPGIYSIRQISSGEIMHSVNSPIEEANALYIQQSQLKFLLTQRNSLSSQPLTIWDVGLGAASNAMAAIYCFESQARSNSNVFRRPLIILSFENDLDSLKLALNHLNQFPHLLHPAPQALLTHGYWKDSTELLQWKLIEGDFLSLFKNEITPDLIYYDLYSSKTNPTFWTCQLFKDIFVHCESHPRTTHLYTYSASTSARVALLWSGFFVARGIGTGPKLETTVAFTRTDSDTRRFSLLDSSWLERWNRSHVKFPQTLHENNFAEFEKKIRGHPQFCNNWLNLHNQFLDREVAGEPSKIGQ